MSSGQAHHWRLAIVPSTDVFEQHFGAGLNLTRNRYVREYRNDWLFEYATGLHDLGWQPAIVMPSRDVTSVERHQSSRAPVEIVFTPARGLVRALPDQLRRTEVGRWLWSATSGGAPLVDELTGYDAVYVQEYAFGRFANLCSALARRAPSTVLIGAHHGAGITGFSSAVLRRTRPPSLLTVLTPAEEAELTRRLPGHAHLVHVVANPVDTTVFHAEVERSADVCRRGLIWVGRMDDRHKGLSVLLRALESLPPALWSPLRLIGDGPDRSSLERLSRKLGIEEHVVFIGFERDRSQLARWYRAAAAFVLPSNFEGAPLVLLEAQACGLPVIASDLPGVRALAAADTSTYHVLGSVTDLRRAISQVMGLSESERLRRGQQAAEDVRRRFSRSATLGELDRLIRRAVLNPS